MLESPKLQRDTKNELWQGAQGAMTGLGLAESRDDSLRALNFILEAWEEGTDSGIAPELMAYAAIYAALSDLVGAYGEDAVVKLAQGLVPRVKSGEFTLVRVQQ